MDFTQPWNYSDVTFLLEDRKIYANKATLGMSSEVFRAMFTSEFKEKEMTELPLPDKKFDDFLQLMQILHPQFNKCVDDTNVYSILPLAHEYQIHHVVENCEKYLMTEPSIHNLILAEKLSLPKLREVCVKYVTGVPYHQLVKDPGFKKLDSNMVLELFHAKLKICDGAEISQEACLKVINNLRSEEPSIENLQLAQMYNVTDAYVKCLQYAKNTPLSKLGWEIRYLKPSTHIEVLESKIRQSDDIRRRIYKISRGAEYDNSHVCTHEEVSPVHRLGQTSGIPPCAVCLHYNMDKIQKLVEAEI